MKTRYILGTCTVAFMVLIISLTSCTKLKDENYSRFIQNNFIPNTSDVAALVGAGYTYWRPLMLGRSNNSIFRTNEISSDEAVIPARPNGWVDNGIYRRMHEHRWTSDEDNSYQIWNNAYGGITSCNRVLYQIQSNLIPITTGKDATIAELRALRASYYYALCDFFGGVPIVDKFDVPSGFLPQQNTRAQVYAFIVKELTESLPNLSKANNQATYGKFNYWAATALLAKVYLNANVYIGTPAYTQCIAACNEIIASNVYTLEANQKSIFLDANEGSRETIFAIPFDEKFTADGANAFTLHMETLQPENQATYNFKNSPWGGICATPQFVSTFDPEDNRLKDNYVQGQQYTASGAVLLGTIGASNGKPLIYINELPGVDQSDEVHGFRLGKFEFKPGALVGMNNDFPLLRYADVLMMKAECLLRTGDAAGAAALVTQVRQRSFSSNPSKATVTGSQLLQGSVYNYGLRNHLTSTVEGGADIQYGRFLDELGWEFNTEGRRRQDMIRFGVFTKKSWLSHSPNGDYRTLLPIPRAELAKNPNIKQNPGY
ncbi:RagB/SusD family nutrient uptake outer membrane protein [Pedobacter suwonensis]|uniref:RagB/SusD family nutrient uptake outer membrane protein n=1 Tax=Pedobacter suwonensis TaxID=332999 RepID=UPI0011A5EA3F|nr:RagB/SusD family nutrient uptake outer membrane protein [Pedobacter suwonensis]